MLRDVLICRISVQLVHQRICRLNTATVAGMGSPVSEGRVKALIDEAIAAACAPSGAIYAAVLASVAKEVAADGTIG
eukprot:7101215-Pyramimonas_sp.AAC.1